MTTKQIIKKIDPTQLGTIDETNSFYINQNFVTPLTDNAASKYLKFRYIVENDFDGFFYVDNLLEWLQQNCKFDDNDIAFLNAKFKNLFKNHNINSIQEITSVVKFIGNIRRNLDGKIFGFVLRPIFVGREDDLNSYNYYKTFFKFFYNNNTNHFELWHDYLRDFDTNEIIVSALTDRDEILNLKEFSWYTTRKKSIDLNAPIFITESIFDSLFLNNSLCLQGVVPFKVIPEKLKDKNLIFILDNRPNKNNTEILKMNYSVFKWPKEIWEKDFGDHAKTLFRESKKSIEEFSQEMQIYFNNMVNTKDNIVTSR